MEAAALIYIVVGRCLRAAVLPAGVRLRGHGCDGGSQLQAEWYVVFLLIASPELCAGRHGDGERLMGIDAPDACVLGHGNSVNPLGPQNLTRLPKPALGVTGPKYMRLMSTTQKW